MVYLSKAQKKAGIVFLLAVGLPFILALVYYFPSASNQGYAPEQPIPFSHKLHAGQYKIACIYCHSEVEKSRHASIPSLGVCMNCHSLVKKESPWIQKLTKAYQDKKPIEWIRVHELPDHAYFSHKRHVAKGLTCEACHGKIQEMERVEQKAPLTMGWCVECHRGETTPSDVLLKLNRKRGSGPVAPLNCSTCHH